MKIELKKVIEISRIKSKTEKISIDNKKFLDTCKKLFICELYKLLEVILYPHQL
jgi:hypothetical protein